MKTLLMMTFVLLAVAGCASNELTLLGDKKYAAKPSGCKLDVYRQKPNRKHIEIGMVNARGSQAMFTSKSVKGLLPKIKESACAAGGDAVVLHSTREGGYNIGQAATRAEASASVIKYTE